MRTIVFATAAVLSMGASALGACATFDNDGRLVGPPDAAPLPGPSDDARATTDAEVPCTDDCAYFPRECAGDILCPNGLFDSANPSGGPESFDVRTSVHLICGRSPSDVWAVGALGMLVHFDGTAWVRTEVPLAVESPRGRVPTLRTLWLADGYEIGVEGFSRIYSRDLVEAEDAGANGWTVHGGLTVAPRAPFRTSGQLIVSGWAPPGSEWLWLSTAPVLPTVTNPSGLVRLRMTDPGSLQGDVAALGTITFNSVHGASANDVWAVGMNGVTLRVTGASSTSPTVKEYNSLTRNALYGVWAAAESDVWAVGFDGTIRHYTGDALFWEVVSDIPTGAHLNAVWGSSASDIWAVGQDAVVLHYDGARWSRVTIGGLGGRRPDLVTVWTSGPGHVWIGGDGVVLSLGGNP